MLGNMMKLGLVAGGGIALYEGFRHSQEEDVGDRLHQAAAVGIIGGLASAAAVGVIGTKAGRTLLMGGAKTGARAARAAGGTARLGMKTWSKIPKPARTLGIVLASPFLAAGVRASFVEPESAGTAYAAPEDFGYDYSDQPTPSYSSGVKRRLAAMNATGDLALGLHRSR